MEMNQTLVRGIIMNAISDIQEIESTDPTTIVSKLTEHANLLDCLSTSYSINARMKLNFPTCVSCRFNCATIIIIIHNFVFCFIQDPIRVTLGTHIGNNTLDNVPDQILYVPLLKNLEFILQNDHIRAQVHNINVPKIYCVYQDHIIIDRIRTTSVDMPNAWRPV